MAKSKGKSKSKPKSKSKAGDAKQRKADDQAVKKARARAKELAADAAKARKTADRAEQAAQKAESKAADAAAASGRPSGGKPDELGLAKLALRAAEAKLTSAELRIEQLEQQLADVHRADDLAVEDALEEAVVDAAVQATVEEALIDAVAQAAPGDDADEAIIVEAVAEDLDVAVVQADLPAEQPDHDGDAERAAEAFAEPTGDGGEADGSTAAEESDGASDGSDEAGSGDAPDDGGSASSAPADAAAEPNEQWTLLQLRDEAKRRGLTGTSNLPKAKLLERLRQA